jgi:hypothetical protein
MQWGDWRDTTYVTASAPPFNAAYIQVDPKIVVLGHMHTAAACLCAQTGSQHISLAPFVNMVHRHPHSSGKGTACVWWLYVQGLLDQGYYDIFYVSQCIDVHDILLPAAARMCTASVHHAGTYRSKVGLTAEATDRTTTTLTCCCSRHLAARSTTHRTSGCPTALRRWLVDAASGPYTERCLASVAAPKSAWEARHGLHSKHPPAAACCVPPSGRVRSTCASTDSRHGDIRLTHPRSIHKILMILPYVAAGLRT